MIPKIPPYTPLTGVSSNSHKPLSARKYPGVTEADYALIEAMWPDYSVRDIAKRLGWATRDGWDYHVRAVWNAKRTIDNRKREAEK